MRIATVRLPRSDLSQAEWLRSEDSDLEEPLAVEREGGLVPVGHYPSLPAAAGATLLPPCSVRLLLCSLQEAPAW